MREGPTPAVAEGDNVPPNVLLFITDQQRWDTLGYTGATGCRTPHLDRLAREGVAFDRCVTPCPLCAPARAALLTGRAPHSTGVTNNLQLPLEQPTLLDVLKEAGYETAFSGKWHLGRGRAAQALDVWTGERGDDYARWLKEHNYPDTWPYGRGEFAFHMPETDAWISSPRTAPQEGRSAWTYDDWIAARALEHLETRRRDWPFFHVCSFWGPHPIFVIPEPYYSRYDPETVPEPANFSDPMEGKPRFQTRSIWHRAARAHGTTWDSWRQPAAVYWGYVTWLDELMGRVLGRLESLGLADDTIVIMTSDHGEQMGSHGIFQKCCMYEESLRVPLLMRAPRLVTGGRRIGAPVSLLDLAPTLARLCGIEEAAAALPASHGRDLSGWLTDAEPVPTASADPAAGAVFSEYTPDNEAEQNAEMRAVVGPRYKYAWNRGDLDELYDTWADPAELHDRAGDAALQEVREALRQRLREWLRATDDPLAEEYG
jgi:arylsulfatase A-like enzyme